MLTFYGRVLHDLLIVFLVLKLTGVISWSWLWVLTPAWIPLVMFLFLFTYFLFNYKNLKQEEQVEDAE